MIPIFQGSISSLNLVDLTSPPSSMKKLRIFFCFSRWSYNLSIAYPFAIEEKSRAMSLFLLIKFCFLSMSMELHPTCSFK